VNLLKTPLHRTAATLAGAFLGMAGAVAVAAPASAHHPILRPESSCANADGTWKVVWEISNSEQDLQGDITEVSPADGSVTGVAVGAVLPKSGDGVLTAQQTVAADVTKAEFKVTAHWLRDGKHKVKTATGEKHKPRKPCTPTSPSPSPSASQSSSPSPSPSVSASSSPSASVSASPSTSPSASVSPSTSPAPSTSVPPITEPEYVFDQTCDTFTVGIDNPAGFQDLTITFTPSVGEPKTVEAPAGKVTTVDFPASEGLKVTATPEGFPDEAATIAYEAPEDCDSSGGAGGEPGLPLTGAAAGSIAGGAAMLVGLGATLFVMARRRKVKFTA
jgi:hypothetical protein